VCPADRDGPSRTGPGAGKPRARARPRLPDPAAAGSRRHGRRLPRARGIARAAGGREGALARAGARRHEPRTLPARGANGSPPDAPQHRAAARVRRGGRDDVSRDGLRLRRVARGEAGARCPAAHRRGPAHRGGAGRGARSRAPPGRRPSRREARQRLDRGRVRPRAARRLRGREGARRRRHDDAGRLGGGNARLHVARTGRGQRQRRRPQRSLLARRARLCAAGGPATFRRRRARRARQAPDAGPPALAGTPPRRPRRPGRSRDALSRQPASTTRNCPSRSTHWTEGPPCCCRC